MMRRLSEHPVCLVNQPGQIGDVSDRGARVDLTQKTHLGPVDITDSREVRLVQQCQPNRAGWVAKQTADGFGRVPARAQQIWAEMADGPVPSEKPTASTVSVRRMIRA
jgi:hypothetical protein